MPNFDCKGPENLGPKTGMKLGKCRKTKLDDFEYPENRPFGKGRRKKSSNNRIVTFNLEK
ncbi:MULTISPECIES: DUF5320 family protein [unclassified Algibacter]|uniref:DUF5320 family protein n=1 Tax=unclassified Algibacter TaxID=2615009 RepID=UPI00131D8CB0|nr:MULTISPECIES: DUF5320 family protein [unclassified Algibacter]MCL5130319.1 DUF5320 domain-containing protein [Algibacter sp. L4_22]